MQPLSRLRSQAGKGKALREEATGIGDTRNRRSSRRLSAAYGGKVAVATDNDSEEQQREQMPASRRSLRTRSDAPANMQTDSQREMQSPAGNHTTRTSRAATLRIRGRPTEQDHQPDRVLRSRATRAATRAKAAARQHDSSPEESSDEEPEPEPLHQRSARASRQTRRVSKLVQGGGELSGEDDSASGGHLGHVWAHTGA